MKYYNVCVVAVTALIFVACGNDDRQEEGIPPAGSVNTLLFYLGGDNDLAGEIAVKMDHISQAAVPAGSRLVVFRDVGNGAPAMLFEMEANPAGSGDRFREVKNYGEVDSADPAVFSSVIDYMLNNYPSHSYGLVFFSHASGWLPAGAFSNPWMRSLGRDGGSEMELAGFAAAIPDGTFDFIIFEACFMAGIEVAWELRDKTRYIVASSAELVSPGFTAIYAETIPLLFTGEAGLVYFAQKTSEYFNSLGNEYNSLTLSVISTQSLGYVAEALDREHIMPPSALDLDELQSFDRYGKGMFYDLGDYFNSALDPVSAAGIGRAIDECIVYKYSTPAFLPSYGGFSIDSHSGFTTYIPSGRYPGIDAGYRECGWYREVISGWVADWERGVLSGDL